MESIKIERLTSRTKNLVNGKRFGESIPKWEQRKEYFLDNRDFVSMWNCEPASTPQFSDVLTVGPLPKSHWVYVHHLKEKVIQNLISGKELDVLSANLSNELSRSSELTPGTRMPSGVNQPCEMCHGERSAERVQNSL